MDARTRSGTTRVSSFPSFFVGGLHWAHGSFHTDRTVDAESEFCGECNNHTSLLASYLGILTALSTLHGEAGTKGRGRVAGYTYWHGKNLELEHSKRLAVVSKLASDACFVSLYPCEIMPYDSDLPGIEGTARRVLSDCGVVVCAQCSLERQKEPTDLRFDRETCHQAGEERGPSSFGFVINEEETVYGRPGNLINEYSQISAAVETC